MLKAARLQCEGGLGTALQLPRPARPKCPLPQPQRQAGCAQVELILQGDHLDSDGGDPGSSCLEDGLR